MTSRTPCTPCAPRAPCTPTPRPSCCTSCKTTACVCCELKITKNLLKVCKTPNIAVVSAFQNIYGATTAPIPYSNVTFTYEVVITNCTCNKYTNLSLFDSLLANVATGTIDVANSSIVVTQGGTSVVPQSVADAVADNGQLLNVEESFINPCTVVRLVVKIVLTAADADICDLSEVLNTLTLEGTIEKVPATLCKPAVTQKFCPVLLSSQLWKAIDNVFVVGPNFVLP